MLKLFSGFDLGYRLGKNLYRTEIRKVNNQQKYYIIN